MMLVPVYMVIPQCKLVILVLSIYIMWYQLWYQDCMWYHFHNLSPNTLKQLDVQTGCYPSSVIVLHMNENLSRLELVLCGERFLLIQLPLIKDLPLASTLPQTFPNTCSVHSLRFFVFIFYSCKGNCVLCITNGLMWMKMLSHFAFSGRFDFKGVCFSSSWSGDCMHLWSGGMPRSNIVRLRVPWTSISDQLTLCLAI